MFNRAGTAAPWYRHNKIDKLRQKYISYLYRHRGTVVPTKLIVDSEKTTYQRMPFQHILGSTDGASSSSNFICDIVGNNKRIKTFRCSPQG